MIEHRSHAHVVESELMNNFTIRDQNECNKPWHASYLRDPIVE